jgi:serine/threonine-protein kinase HipA
MSPRAGVVSLRGRRAGLLRELESGGSAFTYDSDWLTSSDAEPISLTMPLREEPYTSRSMLPFFENLLPEGWLLELATAKLKIAKDDVFGLVLATCRDCIGAVEVEGETGR